MSARTTTWPSGESESWWKDFAQFGDLSVESFSPSDAPWTNEGGILSVRHLNLAGPGYKPSASADDEILQLPLLWLPVL